MRAAKSTGAGLGVPHRRRSSSVAPNPRQGWLTSGFTVAITQLDGHDVVERRLLAALQHQKQQLAANPIMKGEGFSCRVCVLKVLPATYEIGGHQVRLIEVAADVIGRSTSACRHGDCLLGQLAGRLELALFAGLLSLVGG